MEVGILELSWFFDSRKNFVAFSTLLKDLPNSFYKSKFVEYLLD